LRLVAHTAWSDDATRRKAVDAGFDDMLVKPASIAQFLTALADNDAGANAGSGAAAQHYRFGSSGPLR
jgi:ActR/RegA family two-component response regulator